MWLEGSVVEFVRLFAIDYQSGGLPMQHERTTKVRFFAPSVLLYVAVQPAGKVGRVCGR